MQGGNRESMDEITAVGSKFGIPSVDDTMENITREFPFEKVFDKLLINRKTMVHNFINVA